MIDIGTVLVTILPRGVELANCGDVDNGAEVISITSYVNEGVSYAVHTRGAVWGG